MVVPVCLAMTLSLVLHSDFSPFLYFPFRGAHDQRRRNHTRNPRPAGMAPVGVHRPYRRVQRRDVGDLAGAGRYCRGREPHPLPWTAITAASAAETATYQAFDAALRDRLGAQATVTEALGDLFVHALGRSPTSSVIIGSNREPFYAAELHWPCRETEDSLAAVKAGLGKDQNAMAADDRYVLFIVAPDKSSVHRAAIDGLAPDLLRCQDFVRGHFEDWEAEGALLVITLWDDVAARDTASAPAYLASDTRWSASGSLAFSQALLERLVEDNQVSPDILADLANPIANEPVRYVADLNRMMGVTDIDYPNTISFDRPDVVTTDGTGIGVAGMLKHHFTSTSTTSELVRGKTLLIGDSFLLNQMPTQLSNFFADVTMAAREEPILASEYDLVIEERIERYSGTDEWPTLRSTLK